MTDYLKGLSNEEFHQHRLVRNRAQCSKCEDIIESKHRHDFVRCKCGAIAVDGGLEYTRRVGDIHGYIELSEYFVKEKTDK